MSLFYKALCTFIWFRVEGHFLKIALLNGPMTLAALSMDGTDIGSGNNTRKISVQLRTHDWEEDWILRMSPAFKRESSYINLSNIDSLSFIVNLNVDEDEEDCISIDSARSTTMMPLSSRLSPKCKPFTSFSSSIVCYSRTTNVIWFSSSSSTFSVITTSNIYSTAATSSTCTTSSLKFNSTTKWFRCSCSSTKTIAGSLAAPKFLIE